MEFPVLYFTMPDGTELRATFKISGFDWVHIDIAELQGWWVFQSWVVKTHPYSGRSVRLSNFVALPKSEVARWAETEAKAWHKYSKILKAYKP